MKNKISKKIKKTSFESPKNQKKLILILFFCLIVFIIIILMLKFLFNNEKNEDMENNTNVIENNNLKNESYIVNSPQEFVDYLNKYDFIKYDKYEVSYDKIKVVASKNNDLGYKYNIYFDDEELNCYDLYSNGEYSNYLVNGGKFYLLSDNQNDAFVIVNEIGPVAAYSRYLILVFDANGNILLSEQSVVPIPPTEIEINNNTIAYSYETSMGERHGLDVSIGVSEDFCADLNEEYENDDYVVTGFKKFKYADGKLFLEKDIKNTIKKYKNNCEYDKLYFVDDFVIAIKDNIMTIRNADGVKIIDDQIILTSLNDIDYIGYHQFFSDESNSLEYDYNLIDIYIYCNEANCINLYNIYQYNIEENTFSKLK